jgi:DNA-binding Lrp family transcriptional regulator
MQRNELLPTYVFASVEPQTFDDATEHLKTVSGVTWFTPVTGRFDLAVQLKATEPHQTYELINKIREMQGVVSTQTYMPFEGFTNGKKVENSEPFGLVLLGVREQEHLPKVLEALKRIPQIAEAFVVPGEFDVIATLKGSDYEDIISQVQKIAEVKGISTSETLFAYKPIWA